MADYTDIKSHIEDVQDKLTQLSKLVSDSYDNAFTGEALYNYESVVTHLKNIKDELSHVEDLTDSLAEEYENLIERE
jgi:predicted nuclease with TOPRIM domain